MSRGITLALKSEELTFKQAYSCNEAMNLWEKENFSLVILDVNLPDGNGFDILQSIRAHSFVPVIHTKRQVEMRYGTDTAAKMYFCNPTTGRRCGRFYNNDIYA